MNRITIGQLLEITNIYVPVYIENEFPVYHKVLFGSVDKFLHTLSEEQKSCEIFYIRNVDGGHRFDNEKEKDAIVIGITDDDWNTYFGKE